MKRIALNMPIGLNNKNREGYGKRFRIDCSECSKPFFVMLAVFKTGRRKTCSFDCKHARYRRTQSGENNWNFKGATVLRADNETVVIALASGGETVIDATDFPLVKRFAWRKMNNHSSRGYEGNMYAHAVRCGKSVLMHRLILGLQKGYMVDHIDGNSLNNRRSNLRIATASENAHNTHVFQKNKNGFIGVSAYRNKFRATIKIQNRAKYLGVFETAEKAHAAYMEAKKQLLPV